MNWLAAQTHLSSPTWRARLSKHKKLSSPDSALLGGIFVGFKPAYPGIWHLMVCRGSSGNNEQLHRHQANYIIVLGFIRLNLKYRLCRIGGSLKRWMHLSDHGLCETGLPITQLAEMTCWRQIELMLSILVQ